MALGRRGTCRGYPYCTQGRRCDLADRAWLSVCNRLFVYSSAASDSLYHVISVRASAHAESSICGIYAIYGSYLIAHIVAIRQIATLADSYSLAVDSYVVAISR